MTLRIAGLGVIIAAASCTGHDEHSASSGSGGSGDSADSTAELNAPVELAPSPPSAFSLKDLGVELDLPQLSIADGAPTSDPPVAAVGLLLVGGTVAAPQRLCTLTLVSCDAVLTARHCVRRREDMPELMQPSQLWVFIPQGGIYGVRAVQPHADADLAVIYLNRPVTEIDPVSLVTTSPAASGAGYVVGYGRGTGETAIGIRRKGNVHYHACDVAASGTPNDGVCWDYSAGNGSSTTCAGDSGGPLFNSAWQQIGVHSSGTSASCGGHDDATDVRLSAYAADLAAWLPNARVACSNMVKVYWGMTDEATQWDVPVAPNTRLFRVGFTGEFEPGVNRRLTVEFQGAGDPTRCESHPSGAWGFCEWYEPTPGTYRVAVRPLGDRYQLSMMYGL